MKPGDIRPKISRELLERMTKSNDPACENNVCLGTGARSLISSHKIERSGGRKHVADYRSSKLGVRSAFRPGVSSSAPASSQPSSGISRVSKPSISRPAGGFSEPPQRYNPYG